MRAGLASPSAEDINITLILGSVNRSLRSFSIMLEHLSDNSYFSVLPELIRASVSGPFTVVIQGYENYRSFPRIVYAQFKETFPKSYISNHSKIFSFNNIVFALLYSEMVQYSKLPV